MTTEAVARGGGGGHAGRWARPRWRSTRRTRCRPEFRDGQLYVSLRGGSEPAGAAGRGAGQVPAGPRVWTGPGCRLDVEERAAHVPDPCWPSRQMLIVLDDATGRGPGPAAAARQRLVRGDRDRPGAGCSDLAGRRLVDLDVARRSRRARRACSPASSGPARAGGRARGRARRCWRPARACRWRSGSPGAPAGRAPQLDRPDAGRPAGRPAAAGWTSCAAGDLAVRACFQVSFDTLPPRDRATRWIRPTRSGCWASGPGFRPAYPAADRAHRRAAEGQWPTRSRCWSTPTCWSLRRRTGTTCMTCCALTRLSGLRATNPRRPSRTRWRRMLDWYLRTADAAASVVAPYRDRVPLDPAEAERSSRWPSARRSRPWPGARRERANLVTATRLAAAHGACTTSRGSCPWPATVSFDRHGYRTEWLDTNRIALESVRQLGDRRRRGLGAQQHRDGAWSAATFDEAIDYFEQALLLFYRETGERSEIRRQAANNLAFTYLMLGRYEEAVPALLDALELQRAGRPPVRRRRRAVQPGRGLGPRSSAGMTKRSPIHRRHSRSCARLARCATRATSSTTSAGPTWRAWAVGEGNGPVRAGAGHSSFRCGPVWRGARPAAHRHCPGARWTPRSGARDVGSSASALRECRGTQAGRGA